MKTTKPSWARVGNLERFKTRDRKGRLFSPLTLEERFWEKVEVRKRRGMESSRCWLWKGTILKSGYGQFRVGKKRITAHLFSWELHYFKIPPGFQVIHACDNKPCVRPTHLMLGTDGANQIDRKKMKKL